MMGSEGISVADALALRNTGDSDGAGFGGNGWWIVLLILLFAGGRFGGFGGGNEGYGACCTPATQQGMTDAFNFSQLDNGIRDLERGLCDGFYSTAQAINGVDKSILQSDFHVQAGFNALSSQMASCCCNLERGQDSLKCAIEKAAGDILIAGERNTNQIINYLTQTEMDKLRTELQSAQFQLSQLSQTSNIIDRLMPVARPAYITCSPYASAFGIGTTNGCGCC